MTRVVLGEETFILPETAAKRSGLLLTLLNEEKEREVDAMPGQSDVTTPSLLLDGIDAHALDICLSYCIQDHLENPNGGVSFLFHLEESSAIQVLAAASYLSIPGLTKLSTAYLAQNIQRLGSLEYILDEKILRPSLKMHPNSLHNT